MKKNLVVMGTRPEAIKLASLVKILEERPNTECRVVATAQHRQMLDQVLRVFSIHPDVDLDLMRPDQTLEAITARVLEGVSDIVIVQGDTTTAFAAGLAAYYHRVPVAHVEAGLRTDDPYNPFPEELNRRLVDALSAICFAPTSRARANLLREGVAEDKIHVTGNTVVDALLYVVDRQRDPEVQAEMSARLQDTYGVRLDGRALLLVTGHRRESFGVSFENICLGLRDIAVSDPDGVQIVYPVHLNPKVRAPVTRLLSDVPNVRLIEPVDYYTFVFLMSKAFLILTDSGGIQEEAPSLGKPVLVMREKTERPEAIDAGTACLVGTERERIFEQTTGLLQNENEYARMASAENPFGDGRAAERIAETLARL
jgi:UDP-N-acetylglucosamine 2-epimerase (non-hydrolysing)